MPVVESVEDKMPKSFTKTSGQYADMKQQIDSTDFDLGYVKLTCADVDEKRKTLIAVKAYIKKKEIKGLVVRSENLVIFVGQPS